MVAVKAHQADAFLKRLDPRLSAILVFGADEGLVAERARAAAAAIAARDDPPGEIVRIEDADLEADPDRLAVELQTVPMFGGRRILRLTASRRVGAQALGPLLEGPALAGALVVEAGNLKPDEGLRALFEKSPAAAAIACYADEARDLGQVIEEMLAAAGLAIAPEARELLVSRLGADRGLSRAEIEKLLIYVHGRARIEAADVEAAVGDASELAIDRILLAVANGDAARAVVECDRAVTSGESPQLVILSLQRYFQRLERVRAQTEAGRSLDDALRGLRPPLHFKQKDAFAAQVRAWAPARLRDAAARIARAARAARLSGALVHAIAERLALELALLARAEARAAPRR